MVDLFAGAGGLSAGLAEAGFQCLLASEIEQAFARTFQANHPATHLFIDDIRKIESMAFLRTTGLAKRELDLLAGGPPCQGFSVNAPIRSLDDQRNHLFSEFMRLAKAFLPKFILLENVPGMVSLARGSVVRQIYQALEALDYQVDHAILFAAHYGVPQIRYRTIILANRLGFRPQFPAPTHDAKGRPNFSGGRDLCMRPLTLFESGLKPHVSVWDAISDLRDNPVDGEDEKQRYAHDAESAYQRKCRERRSWVRNHQAMRISEINKERLAHIPQGGSWRDIPFDLLPEGMKRARRSDHTKRYGRLDPEGLCSTILTKCDPHWGSFFHPTLDRVISVREAARLQSFSDRFTFAGTMTDQYKQVGNAVPPLLGKALGRQIRKQLCSKI